VWVPGADKAAQRLLEGTGHRLDATPTAMAMELARFECSPGAELALDTEPDAHEVGRINDAAYGMDGDFERAFAKRPGELHLYAARQGDEAVACVGSVHDEVDCGIYLVATLPDARGRGLARDLVTIALNEGRDAGCETASLQSTSMGKPVYTRLGFSDFGPLQMWERRATSAAG
jgi:GNAT superfamily N-acetyltransferase